MSVSGRVSGESRLLGPLGRTIDSLVQGFEDRRAGLKDETIRSGDGEAFFMELYAGERDRLRGAVKLAEPQLSSDERDALLQDLDELAHKVLIPSYSRLAGSFTERERNDFYILRGPARVLERALFAVAGLLLGGFLVWAPFIPLWSKHWIWGLGLAGLVGPELRRYFAWKRYGRELNALVARTDRELERVREGYLLAEVTDEEKR